VIEDQRLIESTARGDRAPRWFRRNPPREEFRAPASTMRVRVLEVEAAGSWIFFLSVMLSAYVRPAADRAELLTFAHGVSVDARFHRARRLRLSVAFAPRAILVLSDDPRAPPIATLGNPTEEPLRMLLETRT